MHEGAVGLLSALSQYKRLRLPIISESGLLDHLVTQVLNEETSTATNAAITVYNLAGSKQLVHRIVEAGAVDNLKLVMRDLTKPELHLPAIDALKRLLDE